MEFKPVRANMYFSGNIKKEIETYAEQMGMSQSAFVTMAVNQFIEQKKALAALNNVEQLVERLDRMEQQLSATEKGES